jgi:hypothetical protein
VRKAGRELAPIRKTVASGVILSNFFPVLIRSAMGRLKPGKPERFAALLEDTYADGFVVPVGTLQLDRPDAFATANQATRFTVKFAGLVNTWWVDEQGSAVRIEIPAAKTRVERATQEQADKFLKAIGATGT